MDNAGYFELESARARAIAQQVGKAVSAWRDEPARHDLTKREIDRMASAFEHKDLELARAQVSPS
jgi:serine/threonine-protein kinase HipA